MRNIFDQYTQPENKLTHALACTLEHDRSLITPFLKHIGIRNIPKTASLNILEQQVPGEIVSGDSEDGAGLPDMCIFDDDDWVVLFESKVQARISSKQKQRHLGTAKRYGFSNPKLVVIAVDKPKSRLDGVIYTEWCELYSWFKIRSGTSEWAQHFATYLEVFETKMLSQKYGIRGTLTMFHGFQFDADNPYTHREGKRLIKLLGKELQSSKELHKIGVDPKGERRGKIKGRGTDRVWDFLPLRKARNAKLFTANPHLTMGLNMRSAVAAITVPNGVRGGFRTKLKEIGQDGFLSLLRNIEKRLQPQLKRCPNAQPFVYVTQRHYKRQGAPEIVDARLDADLRTIVSGNKKGIRNQPEWIEAIYTLLINKNSNIQLGIDVHYYYIDEVIRTPEAIDVFSKSWIAMYPLIKFVLE